MKDEVFEHPAYANLSFSRHRSDRNLLGVDYQATRDLVTLEISSAKVYRSLHGDTIHPKDRLLVLEMTVEQLMRALLNMNSGGVEATLTYKADTGPIPEPPIRSSRQLLLDEFKAEMESLSRDLADLSKKADAILSTGTIKKAEREELKNAIRQQVMQVQSSVPFMATRWAEAIEQIEADAHINNPETQEDAHD